MHITFLVGPHLLQNRRKAEVFKPSASLFYELKNRITILRQVPSLWQ